MLDERRWNCLVKRLTGNHFPKDSFRQIVAAYSEAHRYYHNLLHIEHCLKEFDQVVNLCTSPDEVEFAIWLHDMVYNPHATDNEEMSALHAKEILSKSRCSEAKSSHIQELILATKHQHPPTLMDSQIIVDIDLSILGQPPVLFQKYEENIRAEYSWVHDNEYRFGRSAVLSHFLDLPSIYSTERFQKMYESQARKNITNLLVALAHSPEVTRR